MKSFICVAVFVLYLTTAEGCDRIYTCIDDVTVNILGVNLTCNTGFVCNEFNAGTTCTPCVTQEQKCEKFFKCENDTVNLGGAILNCPENYICNAEGKGACPICVPESCTGTPNFQCDPKDEKKVIYQNTVTNCMLGFVCNKDYVKPCTACIAKGNRFLLF